VKALIKQFWMQQDGLELIEYAVITALLVAAVIVAFTALSAAIRGRLGAAEALL
jgi:Flp pilus assembly pilin Flp